LLWNRGFGVALKVSEVEYNVIELKTNEGRGDGLIIC